jgi:hypothetical protein
MIMVLSVVIIDSQIEFKEFTAFFSAWPVRRLRASTEGLLEAVRLAAEVLQHPTDYLSLHP